MRHPTSEHRKCGEEHYIYARSTAGLDEAGNTTIPLGGSNTCNDDGAEDTVRRRTAKSEVQDARRAELEEHPEDSLHRSTHNCMEPVSHTQIS